MTRLLLLLVVTMQAHLRRVRESAANGEAGYGIVELVITIGTLAAAALVVRGVVNGTVQAWVADWTRG